MGESDVAMDRRTYLAGVSTAVGGLAGCLTVLSATRGGEGPVSILAAGSLYNALERGLEVAVETPLQIAAHGSAEVARMIVDGGKDPDIVSVADTALFASPLRSDWYAEFATNSLVVAYDPDSAGGKRIADAGTAAWYRPLLNGDVRLGRTDPDLDPLGYRTLFALELATDYYGTATDLREAIPRREQVYPETQLLSQFETGGIDAAITYRNMAVERGYEYVDLPPEIDLSEPAQAERYATASYELPGGTVVDGGPISYGSTIRHVSRRVVDVFETHVVGRYLDDFGFVVPDDYPRFTGNVPDAITN